MTHQTFRIPLLKDQHNHPLLYAAFMDGINLNLDPSETRDNAVARILERVKRGVDRLTIAYGWNSGRYPLAKQEFDGLPPLVILNLSLHGLIVNDAGRDLLKQHDSVVVEHLDDDSWIERHLRRVLNVFANADASCDRLKSFFQWLLHEHGVYYAEEKLLVGEEEVRLFEQAGLIERTRFWAAPELYECLPPNVQEMVHGIKLFTDGALGMRTAALNEPYRGSTHSGMLIYENRDALEAILNRCLTVGKPLAIHAIGDRAIEQCISGLEAVRIDAHCDVRIEHAQLISRSTAIRAKQLGIKLSMQPNFSDDSIHYADRLPNGYSERNNPFRMLIDDVGFAPGQDLFFGSDGMPHGVREALRQSLFPQYTDQTLSVDEFVAGYCSPDMRAGHIDVQLDPDNRQVTCRVALDEAGDRFTSGRVVMCER